MEMRAFFPVTLLIVFICTSLSVVSTGCSTAASKRRQLASEEKTPTQLSMLHLELGTNALIYDDFPRAIENLRQAIKLDPENHVAHNHLGLALLGMGQRPDAKAEFEKAVTLNPTYSDAYVNLGAWHFLGNDALQAKINYEKALKNLEYRDRYRALTSLGQLAMIEGKMVEAKSYLQQALTENKEYCLANLLMGTLFLNDNQSARAQGFLKTSIKGTCSNNVDGHYQLGIAYSKLEEYKKARTQFLQIMEQFPNTALAEKANDELRRLPL